MKSLILALTLATSTNTAPPPKQPEICINPHSLSFLFVRQGDNVYLLSQAISCKGQPVAWEIDVTRIELITIPEQPQARI